MECIWSAETGFSLNPDCKQTLSAAPSLTVLDAYSTVSAGACNGRVHVSWFTRCTRVTGTRVTLDVTASTMTTAVSSGDCSKHPVGVHLVVGSPSPSRGGESERSGALPAVVHGTDSHWRNPGPILHCVWCHTLDTGALDDRFCSGARCF